MIDQFVPIGGADYFVYFAALFFARGMDFLSTWIGTPNLVLEANPISSWLGWRRGLALNLIMCAVIAVWPLPALTIATSSLLVAIHNFQMAWLMRSLGEHRYRCWMTERLGEVPIGLFLFCLAGQAVPMALIGAGLMMFSGQKLVPFAMGAGFITYAVALTVFTVMSVQRIRRL